jgi:hypothetical protein
MGTERAKSRCKAQTKAGKPCRAAATPGGLCFFHANPNKAAELGRIGGRKKYDASTGDTVPLPPLDNVTAIRDTAGRLIEEMYLGKMDPKKAVGLATLLNLQLRTIGPSEIERRLAQLEKEIADAKLQAQSVATDGQGISVVRR